MLLGSDGTWLTVSDVNIVDNPLQAYNLSVSEYNSFFAGGTPDGVVGVWVHNKCSGKNPPINKNRQELHTNGTKGKSQFKDGIDVDNIVQDTWKNGTPQFNKNGEMIGKVKRYKDVVGTQGQKSVDTRFSRRHGVHGWPSNKKE